jgi:hypothetical protein
VYSLLREFPVTNDEGHPINSFHVDYNANPVTELDKDLEKAMDYLLTLHLCSAQCAAQYGRLVQSVVGGDVLTHVDPSAANAKR